jgi:hypothetical protein
MRNDALLQLVQEQQRTLASSLGIDVSFAGIPHHAVYDQIFRLLHLERAVRARFGPGEPPLGWVGIFRRAAVEALDISEEYFDKLRKGQNKCLAGERAMVSWLRPRDR